MPPEATATRPPLRTIAARIPADWRRPLALLAAAWAALLVLFARDWADMAGQWWDSSTYNHILLVPPILAWLVSQRLDELGRLSPSAWWPGLGIVAGAALLWVLGDFAGLSLARQVGAVAMLQGAAVTLLGPRVAAALLFPLAYMLFLVPAGDELIPLLQTVTAHLTMAFLALTGVPATMDGVFITTRFGYFEVAEACSGIKFLVAMIAYGALVANVCFRSPWRRAVFMVLSVVVPILANGARAWGTIYIAGIHGIAFAQGFDHVFYGWIFFAVVMALVMAAGWKFFDRPADAPMIDAEAIGRSPLLARAARLGIGAPAALGAVLAIAALATAWAGAASRLSAPLPDAVTLPEVPGWTHLPTREGTPWEPLHGGADRRLRARYADAAGHVVDVSFALYAAQHDGKEAGGFGEGAMPLGSTWAWESPGPAFAGAKSDVIQAPGPVHRLAVTWYRTGQVLTGSNARLKLANIADRLVLHAAPTATLILSAEARPGDQRGGEAAVRAFLAASGPADVWMDRLSGLR